MSIFSVLSPKSERESKRAELKEQKARQALKYDRIAELESAVNGTVREIDLAVEIHAVDAGRIQEKLRAAEVGSPRRAALVDELDTLNEALDKRCRELRARERRQRLEQNAMLMSGMGDSPSVIDDKLVALATPEQAGDLFHSQEEINWLTVRTTTAEKEFRKYSERSKDDTYTDESRVINAKHADKWERELSKLRPALFAAQRESEKMRREIIES